MSSARPPQPDAVSQALALLHSIQGALSPEQAAEIKPAQQRVQAEPTTAQAWSQLGQALLALKTQAQAAERSFQQALQLNPNHALACYALAQGHLRRQEFAPATALLVRLLEQPAAPRSAAGLALRWKALHALVHALLKTERIDDARAALARAAELAAHQPAPAWVEPMSWRLGSFWWEPVQGASLRLRRPQAADAPWLKTCFADDEFAAAVNRNFGMRIRAMSLEQVAQELTSQLKKSPADLGAQMLVIERCGGERLGLAAFVMIDSDSRRAEFILGFQGVPPHGVVVFESSCLLAEFAFRRAQFHKVTASFYGDNPRLRELERIVQSLGFQPEGVLRAHQRLDSGQYIDIRLWGALRDEMLTQPALRRLVKRFLGPHCWSDPSG